MAERPRPLCLPATSSAPTGRGSPLDDPGACNSAFRPSICVATRRPHSAVCAGLRASLLLSSAGWVRLALLSALLSSSSASFIDVDDRRDMRGEAPLATFRCSRPRAIMRP
jgi:hypothetical protein